MEKVYLLVLVIAHSLCAAYEYKKKGQFWRYAFITAAYATCWAIAALWAKNQ